MAERGAMNVNDYRVIETIFFVASGLALICLIAAVMV
jgi:hypothetical protein